MIFGPFIYVYINFVDNIVIVDSDRINHLRILKFILIISYSFITTQK